MTSSVSECERQTHKRTLTVDAWRGRIGSQHGRYAINAQRDLLQWRRHVKNDLGAERGDKRHVADELDRVAVALLGQEQNGLAFDEVALKQLVTPGPDFRG